jgi:hypothetical protein
MEDEALLEGVGGRLHIELSEPTTPITERLHNRKALPEATILSMRLEAHVYEDDDFRPLTEAELSAVAFPHPEIVMRGLGRPVRHAAPNGAYFTVRDLLAAVEETERATRPESSWFGGVDAHHVFFEGLYPDGEGVWEISWGS